MTSQNIINLGLGDPTHYKLHPPPPAVISATRDALEAGNSNGYVAGVGSLSARQALVDYHQRWDRVKYAVDDMVLVSLGSLLLKHSLIHFQTHGVGQALDLIFSVLFPRYSSAEPTNILLPRPGFPQYEALLVNIGTEIRYYDCVEESGWEVDLEMLESQCDSGTRAILIVSSSTET